MFYRISILRKTPLMACAALPENIKVSTVSQETIRRMKNTSRDLNSQVIEDIISEYISDLLRGGFPKNWVFNSVMARVTGYSRMVKNELDGKGPVNRPEAHTRKIRRFKRLCLKSSWFKGPKNLGQNQPPPPPSRGRVTHLIGLRMMKILVRS